MRKANLKTNQSKVDEMAKTEKKTKEKKITFATWQLSAKGKLTREEIYNYL
jgi:hypothetical protein